MVLALSKAPACCQQEQLTWVRGAWRSPPGCADTGAAGTVAGSSPCMLPAGDGGSPQAQPLQARHVGLQLPLPAESSGCPSLSRGCLLHPLPPSSPSLSWLSHQAPSSSSAFEPFVGAVCIPVSGLVSDTLATDVGTGWASLGAGLESEPRSAPPAGPSATRACLSTGPSLWAPPSICLEAGCTGPGGPPVPWHPAPSQGLCTGLG